MFDCTLLFRLVGAGNKLKPMYNKRETVTFETKKNLFHSNVRYRQNFCSYLNNHVYKKQNFIGIAKDINLSDAFDFLIIQVTHVLWGS